MRKYPNDIILAAVLTGFCFVAESVCTVAAVKLPDDVYVDITECDEVSDNVSEKSISDEKTEPVESVAGKESVQKKDTRQENVNDSAEGSDTEDTSKGNKMFYFVIALLICAAVMPSLLVGLFLLIRKQCL